MRNFNNYSAIYVDIDETLIYGWYVKLMDITWKLFANKTLAKFLMHLQDKYDLYKINHRLVMMLNDTSSPVIFITARGKSTATENIIEKLFPKKQYGAFGLKDDSCYYIVELESNLPDVDKVDYIMNMLRVYPEVLLIDDNVHTRRRAKYILDVDTLNPKLLYEQEFVI